jgi:hypothetical protein
MFIGAPRIGYFTSQEEPGPSIRRCYEVRVPNSTTNNLGRTMDKCSMNGDCWLGKCTRSFQSMYIVCLQSHTFGGLLGRTTLPFFKCSLFFGRSSGPTGRLLDYSIRYTFGRQCLLFLGFWRFSNMARMLHIEHCFVPWVWNLPSGLGIGWGVQVDRPNIRGQSLFMWYLLWCFLSTAISLLIKPMRCGDQGTQKGGYIGALNRDFQLYISGMVVTTFYRKF